MFVVRELWGDILSSPAVKSVQKSLVTMKDTVKESLIDFSESRDFDEEEEEESHTSSDVRDGGVASREDSDHGALASQNKKGETPRVTLDCN